MPKVQAGGNSFLTWNRQPATCHPAPRPPEQTHKQARLPAYTQVAEDRSVTTPHLLQTQVHALLLPLANYHLQTPCIVSLLPVSDL